MDNYVAIMAGGVGSRFWPGSREARPKQFLDMTGAGKSLLRQTFDRFLPIVPASNIFIVTNALYKDLVKEQLPEITDNQILCEPSRNNTAPCIAYMALKLAALDENANFVVASSDHLILKEDVFLDKITTAFDFAGQNDAIITIGLQPSRADTGYGYIQFAEEAAPDVRRVVRFAEKPSQEFAEQYVESGEYLWNAGIFVWNVQTILRAYREHATDIYDILAAGDGLWNTDAEQDFINANYPRTPNISVDFAIMEKAGNVFTVPAEIGWSDLGTWASLHEECVKDAAGNALLGNKILVDGAKNNLIRAPKDKLIVVKDLSDYIIVDEGDVLLIYPKSKEQEIKQVTALVKKETGEAYL
jgi:mannose-1-phosphate guanylyltransferase